MAIWVDELISGILSTHAEIIMPITFIGFFLFGGIACLQRGYTRRVFVAIIVSCLILSSVFALTVYPFIHAQRYSNVAEQTYESEYIWVVDSSGNELMLDDRVNSPFRGRRFAPELVTDSDTEEQLEVARWILQNSEKHRDSIQSSMPRVVHPPPSANYYWDEERLDGYSEFESVRVYSVQSTYFSDSHRLKERKKVCLIEITPETNTVSEECSNV